MTATAVQRPIAIDLFAGAGGLSLGMEQAGFDIAAAVEIDPIHCGVHHYNFPHAATICQSVVELTGESIRALAQLGERDIDLVCGGAPCQGFSTIGKRALDDERNKLVYHYCRIVGELRPKYAVFENVRGLTFGAHKKFLSEIIEALESHGYRVIQPYRVLNAADYGTPQDRKRLFLVAARADQALPEYPEPSGRTTVGEAILDLPNADDFAELSYRDWVKIKKKSGSTYAGKLQGTETDDSDFSYPRQWDRTLLTSSMRTEHTELSRQRFSATQPGKVEAISRFLKLDPNGLCNTLRAGTDSARGAFTSPRPIHPIYDRVITVREAARLHSYPDWFRFHSTKWHGFRQIGNSVPPLLARAVGREVMKTLGIVPIKPERMLPLGEETLLNLSMVEAVAKFGLEKSPIANRIRRDAVQDERNSTQISMDYGY
ncbi:DNA cytosine methyltransferase [Derxia lacustris]|uniref:DNA cytosine methyltransferase n=1 Tax=Derxia lacustris TaxID=764842 RepID=UPI000A177326|nr:DNA cytosine methyltransferase [Derxia lacustris]